MERVLIGVDEEQASQVAVDWVIERAKTVPMTITLFTAFDMLVNDPVTDQGIVETTRARIRAAVPAADVHVEVAERSILEGLAERSADADLLVIGSHPHRRVRSVLTGALPSALVSRTVCALVVVPDDWEPGSDTIVLGASDDDSSDAASIWAAQEAVARGTDLVAVHAWRFPVPSMDATAALLIDPDEIDAIHRELIERVLERIGDAAPGVQVRTVLRHGDAAYELDDIIDSAGLLVLGTRGHGPTLGTFLGSVVQHMLHHGRVPVCIVPNTFARQPALSNAR